MKTNTEFQEKFLHFGKNTPISSETLTACGDLSVSQAISIYQNNYFQNLNESLANTFEAIQEILGEDFFKKITPRYIQTNSLVSPNIIDYGSSFPDYLHSLKELVEEIPFLPELARLEWKIKELFLETPQTEYVRELNQLEDDQSIRLVNAKIMKISHPVQQIWLATLHRKEGEITPEKESVLVIVRQQETIYYQTFSLDLWSFLLSAQKSTPLKSLAQLIEQEKTKLQITNLIQFLIQHHCLKISNVTNE